MKFEYRPYNQHATDDQLIKDLKAVACKLNSASISSKEYDNCGLYSSCTIARRFGSWNHALSLAGLDARNVFHSEEDLFHNIEIVWMKKGKQPTRADMNNKSLSVISSGSYLRRFGKWSSARDQVKAVWACPRGGIAVILSPHLHQLENWRRWGVRDVV